MQLQTFITQDPLVRFALWSEHADPLTRAVREVSHAEISEAVRFSGAWSWFVHNPASPHCGTCELRDGEPAHWLACLRCAALRWGTPAASAPRPTGGGAWFTWAPPPSTYPEPSAPDPPRSETTDTFHSDEEGEPDEIGTDEYERQVRHQELHTCDWYDDPAFDHDPECEAWRQLAAWAMAASRREALQPTYTPGEAQPWQMSENGIPPFDPDTDMVDPFDVDAWDQFDWWLHGLDDAVEESILQHSIGLHHTRWELRRADNIAANVGVVESYLLHWREGRRCSHPGTALFLESLDGAPGTFVLRGLWLSRRKRLRRRLGKPPLCGDCGHCHWDWGSGDDDDDDNSEGGGDSPAVSPTPGASPPDRRTSGPQTRSRSKGQGSSTDALPSNTRSCRLHSCCVGPRRAFDLTMAGADAIRATSSSERPVPDPGSPPPRTISGIISDDRAGCITPLRRDEARRIIDSLDPRSSPLSMMQCVARAAELSGVRLGCGPPSAGATVNRTKAHVLADMRAAVGLDPPTVPMGIPLHARRGGGPAQTLAPPMPPSMPAPESSPLRTVSSIISDDRAGCLTPLRRDEARRIVDSLDPRLSPLSTMQSVARAAELSEIRLSCGPPSAGATVNRTKAHVLADMRMAMGLDPKAVPSGIPPLMESGEGPTQTAAQLMPPLAPPHAPRWPNGTMASRRAAAGCTCGDDSCSLELCSTCHGAWWCTGCLAAQCPCVVEDVRRLHAAADARAPAPTQRHAPAAQQATVSVAAHFGLLGFETRGGAKIAGSQIVAGQHGDLVTCHTVRLADGGILRATCPTLGPAVTAGPPQPGSVYLGTDLAGTRVWATTDGRIVATAQPAHTIAQARPPPDARSPDPSDTDRSSDASDAGQSPADLFSWQRGHDGWA